MRFVIQVEEDSGIVGVEWCEILPEHNAVRVGHGMLPDVVPPLVAIRPVQIEDDVAILRSAFVHDLMNQIAIGLAVAVLFRCLAEPAILR